MRNVHRAIAPLAVVLFVLLPSREAEAYERQWHAGASAGYVLMRHNEQTNSGLGAGLHLAYGLSDAFNLMVEAGVAGHRGGDMLTLNGSAGVAYVFDVLEWVPYAGFMVGVHDVWLRGCEDLPGVPCGHDVRPSITLPAGIDYQLSRSFALGLTARYSFLFFGDTPASGQQLFLGGRAEFVWGY